MLRFLRLASQVPSRVNGRRGFGRERNAQTSAALDRGLCTEKDRRAMTWRGPILGVARGTRGVHPGEKLLASSRPLHECAAKCRGGPAVRALPDKSTTRRLL